MTLRRSGSQEDRGHLARRKEIEKTILRARQAEQDRLKGYREQSLRIHPWICARCGRAFTHKNLHLLTVHHKDHNHDNNPSDGSNWENLCIYCHDNEHSRFLDHNAGRGTQIGDDEGDTMTHRPFAGLEGLLRDGKK
ncbi:MAG: HNH nuclease family protein [Deltaproteobacteria bacterium]|nr:HNH nuclease family protein [Deltaproteobacteria bacterium]